MQAHVLTYIFLLTEATLRIVLAVHVIYRGRSVGVTLAWLILLISFPIGSEFFYLLIGENQLGARRLKRYEELTAGMQRGTTDVWRARGMTVKRLTEDLDPIARFGTAIGGFEPLHGNRLTLLDENETVLESLVSDIDSATDHVHMLYYIWASDSGGERIGLALMRAVKRGVKCRVLVDGVGSWAFIGSPLYTQMIAGGVQVVEALPVNILRRPLGRVDLRNHRKITVIDGIVAYCGSQNIHDVSFRGKRGRKTGQWIDATVRMTGPAVQALAVTFLRDWHLDSDEDMGNLERYFPEPTARSDDCVVQVVPSLPGGGTPMAIHQALLTLIYSARRELVITTPYFVPDDATLSALVAVASRGVCVTLVMPRVSDSILVGAAGRAHFQTLLDAGTRIYLYRKGLLHSKVVTMDRKVSLIGSANLDARSFFLNFEATMFVYDADFTSVVNEMQLGYMRDAIEVTSESWRQRPQWKVFRDNVARLFGPLL